jgi:GNAT superfamily N-acetyltransferase
MRVEVISIEELRSFTHADFTIVKIMLFGGDRLGVCDEGVAVKDDAGKILGVASIAPNGECDLGVPTIVGLYTVPEARRAKVGYTVFEAAVKRCIARGFTKVRVDALSKHVLRIVDKLPDSLRSAVEVSSAGGTEDEWWENMA